MSGSIPVGTLGIIESNRAFRPMQLAVWTGHGWLPIRGVQATHIQVRMHPMGGIGLGGGFDSTLSGLAETELTARLDHQPMVVPADPLMFDHARIASVVFHDISESRPLTPAPGPAIRGVATAAADFIDPRDVELMASRVIAAQQESRIHPLDDPPDTRPAPVGSREEAQTIHRERDADPTRPRNRRLRFIEE